MNDPSPHPASALERFAATAADLANQAAVAEAELGLLDKALNDEAANDAADKNALVEITRRIDSRAHWVSVQLPKRDELKESAEQLREEARLAAQVVEELRARPSAPPPADPPTPGVALGMPRAGAAPTTPIPTVDPGQLDPPPAGVVPVDMPVAGASQGLRAMERLAAEQAARENGAQA